MSSDANGPPPGGSRANMLLRIEGVLYGAGQCPSGVLWPLSGSTYKRHSAAADVQEGMPSLLLALYITSCYPGSSQGQV